jgi:hypothetical protein
MWLQMVTSRLPHRVVDRLNAITYRSLSTTERLFRVGRSAGQGAAGRMAGGGGPAVPAAAVRRRWISPYWATMMIINPLSASTYRRPGTG